MMDRNLSFSLYVIILTCFVYVQNKELSANPCGSTQLPCDDSQCIRREKWCDKKRDCRDGSDEKYCEVSKWSYFRYVSPHTCSKAIHFECYGGPCVPFAAKCDGFKDCEDESDESRCENSSTESSTASSTAWDPFHDFSKFPSTAPETTTPSIQLSKSEDITSKNKFTVKTPETVSTPVSRHDKPRTQSTTVTSTFDNRQDPKYLSSPRTTPSSRNRNVTPTRTTSTKQSSLSPTSGYGPSTTQKNKLSSHQNQKNVRPTIPRRIRTTISQLHNYSTSKTKKYRTLTTPMDYYYSRQQAENPYGTSTREPEIADAHVRMTHNMNTKQVVYPENSELRSGRTEFSKNSYPNEQQQIRKEPINVQLRRKYVHSTPYKFDAPRDRTQALLSIKKSTGVLLPFDFSRNYSEEFHYKYTDNIQLTERYLIEKRDSHSWGKDSPRALIALSLISNSFMSNEPEQNLMKKKLEADLGLKLLKLKSEPSSMSNSKLASYINALMATCQNPKDFFGQDLIQLLSARRISPNLNEKPMNPFVILTLCLNNFTIGNNELHDLRGIALASRQTQSEADKDIQIMATTALSCYQHYKEYKNYLNSSLVGAFWNIVEMGHEDGSFGSLHSTALAAQSLMSMSSSIPITWDAQKTVDYLVKHQKEDGSFGDMLGTYLALPVMTGRSLLHLRNTKCDPLPNKTSIEEDLNVHGPKISIHYTLKVGYPETSTILSMAMNVPQGYNFLEIMKMAAKLNPRFRFMYDEEPGNLHVHTIFEIPNDPELGSRWHLYVVDGSGPEFFTIDLQREEFSHDIRNLKPSAYQELIYWYLSI